MEEEEEEDEAEEEDEEELSEGFTWCRRGSCRAVGRAGDDGGVKWAGRNKVEDSGGSGS